MKNFYTKRFIIQTLLLLVVAAFSSSCASIVSDKNYDVAINSSPQGANFKVIDEDNKVVRSGTTPSTISLPAGGPYFDIYHYTIEFNKPGFDPRTEIIQTSLDNWYWGNIFIGGLIGMLIVDPLTGSMYEIDSTAVTANLNPLSPTSPIPYNSNNDSVVPAASNIRELRRLLDERLITPADYERKKNEMLKKM